MQVEGQERRELRRVAREAQHHRQIISRKRQPIGLTAGGIGQIDPDGVAGKLGANLLVGCRRVAETCMTGRLARAAGKDARQRGLRIERARGPERQLRWYDTIEDDTADSVRKAAQVLLRDYRAVRRAIEIDPVIAQCRAHPVEVLNGDAGGVEPNVGVRAQRFETALGAGNDRRGRILREIVRVGRAIQRVGIAGAALIEEDDVAVTIDECEDRLEAGVEGGRTHARAASENEERIGTLARADGRHHRDPQRDLAPAGSGGILRHGQSTALGLNQRQVEGLMQLARRQRQMIGRCGLACPGTEQSSRQQGGSQTEKRRCGAQAHWG